MGKTLRRVAIYSHFDSRGGTTGIMLEKETYKELIQAHERYLREVFNLDPDNEEEDGKCSYNAILGDFTGVATIWVPDEVDTDREILFGWEGEYHIIGLCYHRKDGTTFDKEGIYEICRAIDSEEFEPPQHIHEGHTEYHDELFRIADNDFGEDAFGLILI